MNTIEELNKQKGIRVKSQNSDAKIIIIEYDNSVELVFTVSMYNKCQLAIRPAINETLSPELSTILYTQQSVIKNYRKRLSPETLPGMAKTVGADVRRLKRNPPACYDDLIKKFHANLLQLETYYTIKSAFPGDAVKVLPTYNFVRYLFYHTDENFLALHVSKVSGRIKEIAVSMSTEKALDYALEYRSLFDLEEYYVTESLLRLTIKKEMHPLMVSDLINDLKKTGAVRELIAKFMLSKMK